jgi:mannose-6-phosphate isomerase-like protein (cupin superfamily)
MTDAPPSRSLEYQPYTGLTAHASQPRSAGGPAMRRAGLVIGEWSLERAAWTDLHHHDEITVLIEGSLTVSTGEESVTLRPGDRVAVPAGHRARYEASRYARMLYIYGPSGDGHATIDGCYEALGPGSD